MSKSCKFSVLMSVYKNETASNIKECLESIFIQTMKPDELIIVYDGPISNDVNSVIEDYSKLLTIKKVVLTENVGLGNALSIGLDKCEYDLVARMDSDDICVKDRFETQIGYMESNPDIDILGSGIMEFGDGKNREKILPLKESDIRGFAWLKNPINHMTVVFRKNKIISLGGYVHHLYMEDYNLWLRALCADMKIINLPQVLVYARVGNDMIKRRRGIKYIKSEFKLFTLKYKLKIFPIYKVFISLIIRIVMRLIPAFVLGRIYNVDRGQKNA